MSGINTEMNDTIDWLIKMESAAKLFYSSGAKAFAQDHALCEFLTNLAHDESVHLDEILRIGELMRRMHTSPPIIKVEPDIKEKHLRPLIACTSKIKDSTITKDEILSVIVDIEFSEWNDVFIYVLNEAKARMRSFIPSAVNLQNHKNYITRYVSTHYGSPELLKRLAESPKFWEEKILVVDDFSHIRQLIKSVLSASGIVETAGNAEDALRKVDETYFAVIVSDVGMEGMDGKEFYLKAIEKYPRLKDCFLFFTASDDTELINFFKENDLRHLKKPAGINELRAEVKEILSRKSK